MDELGKAFAIAERSARVGDEAWRLFAVALPPAGASLHDEAMPTFNPSFMIELSDHRSLRKAAVSTAVLAALLTSVPLAAQQAAPAPAPVITVGSMAPDFDLRGATRYGLLANRVRLSDFRGQTVVIAFFPKARTKG
jgi:hypothetical protein